MAKKVKRIKKPKTTKTWLVPHLRNIARNWPEKNTARNRAKIKVQIGFFKNGKPEYRTMFKCANCAGNFCKEDTQMDHREPVIDPAVGFIDWNTYITRLLCTADGYDCLCKPCHAVKTGSENEERVVVKKAPKKLKKDDLY